MFKVLNSPNHLTYYIKFLNRQKVFWTLFLLLIGFDGISQLIKVNDMLTQEPLSDVYIFNEKKNKYTSTNDNGFFDLKLFSVKDTLTLSIIGYDDKKITVEDIILSSGLIEMSVNEKNYQKLYFQLLELLRNQKKSLKRLRLSIKIQ